MKVLGGIRSLIRLVPRSANNVHARNSSHETQEPWIPRYVRSGEDRDTKKARLLYQSRKRGMLENDLLLSTFAHRYLDGFSDEALDQYDALINGPSNDWDIFYWAVNKKATPDEYKTSVMDLLKEHARNTKKENRTRQPSLY